MRLSPKTLRKMQSGPIEVEAVAMCTKVWWR
jgi:hypothetical protein